ncbi:hypothetical protein [Rickettsia oklahomensis]|uniref:Uncharacterized protein n=1 Tax=Rickettsia oklahomensis TaxID=3141789 RepID=A0AAU7BXN2_9RICK
MIKDQVLLLLDSYDKIAFLSGNNCDYRNIMKAVFHYKNVIINFRPYALCRGND